MANYNKLFQDFRYAKEFHRLNLNLGTTDEKPRPYHRKNKTR